MTQTAVEPDPAEGRRRHYGHFYGLDPLPEEGLVLVWGNCQAESLRRLVMGVPAGDPLHETGALAGLSSVRIPPAFEIQPDEVPHLRRVLAHTRVLISQPIPDDYRTMPVGTARLVEQLPPGAQVLRLPVVYDTSRFPWQVTLRHWKVARGAAERPGEDPPRVPYLDLREVARVAVQLGLARPGMSLLENPDDDAPVQVPANAVRSLAIESAERLARREAQRELMPVSDLVAADRGVGFHTANHPDNPVLRAVAARVLERLGADPADVVIPEPGRVLLGGVRTPLEEQVVSALGLEVDAREDWLIGGEPVAAAEIASEHRAWLRENPRAVQVALERFGDTLRTLQVLE
ncbi:MAG: WcbI family polysaccharide biosynthesis putative acetyltransferase [Micrococcus sp.]|nr:WcbI family polysaccharide biosynthesis putative acetyltransferase [Micrococcus sp.]